MPGADVVQGQRAVDLGRLVEQPGGGQDVGDLEAGLVVERHRGQDPVVEGQRPRAVTRPEQAARLGLGFAQGMSFG